MRAKSQTGHRDRLSKDPQFNKLLMSVRGHEKKVLYAWVRSDGKLLSTPHDDLKTVEAIRGEMQKLCDDQGYTFFLDRFFYEDTEDFLRPPPDPDEVDSFRRGGHAVGGPPSVKNANEAVKVLGEVALQQYAHAKDCKFYVEGNSAYIEHDNVRAWVTRSDDLGMDKPVNLPFEWSAHVTMINRWNEDYHDVHLGNFRDEYDAIHEAMTAFFRYQMIEREMDHY